MDLKMRRKRKRRLPSRIKKSLEVPEQLNATWSVDFMSDALISGRRFRVLNVIDDCNREALINEAHFSFPAEQLVNTIRRLIKERGKPEVIRVDNGPEFISKIFTKFCDQIKVIIQYIQPGQPSQNAYIERFNRTYNPTSHFMEWARTNTKHSWTKKIFPPNFPRLKWMPLSSQPCKILQKY